MCWLIGKILCAAGRHDWRRWPVWRERFVKMCARCNEMHDDPGCAP